MMMVSRAATPQSNLDLPNVSCYLMLLDVPKKSGVLVSVKA